MNHFITPVGKRARSSNFSKEEELLLIQEVRNFKDIIECKTTNKTSISEKEDAWNKVTNNFNSNNLENRTTLQLKSKYDNLKSKARKEAARLRLNVRGTGGGSCYGDIDPILLAILDIVNIKTVAGLSNLYDSDCDSHKLQDIYSVEPEKLISEVVGDCSRQCTIIPETEEMQMNLMMEHDPVPIFISEIQSCSSTKGQILDHDYSEASYNTPNEEVIEQPPTKKRKDLYNVKDQESQWSKYVPNKLKTKVSRRLRPTAQNPVYSKELYYKRKLQLLEQCVERENLEREARIRREEEEHNTKMILYNLKIQLKTLELEKFKK